jgi:hypothetical protein
MTLRITEAAWWVDWRLVTVMGDGTPPRDPNDDDDEDDEDDKDDEQDDDPAVIREPDDE